MSFHFFRTASLILALATTLLSSADAFAQTVPDGPRFRGGSAIQGGGLIIPGQFNTPYLGASGQVGVQINNLVGLYLAPQFDVVFGEVYGVAGGTALMVDFTFGDVVSVGVGPEVAGFAAFDFGLDLDEGEETATQKVSGGALYGARLRAAVYPYVGKGDNGYTRKAFAIGLDLRLLGGSVGTIDQGLTDGQNVHQNVSLTNFVFAPQLTLGYQAF